MFAKRERLLLLVLCSVVALCALVIVFSLGAERLKSARASAAQNQTKIMKLRESLRSEGELSSERDQLKDRLAGLRTKYYSSREISPFTFGTIVQKKLSSRGIKVIRYQMLEQKEVNSLEFTVEAPVSSLILFLKDVSDYERYWTISSFKLTMREGVDAADAVFRIGYEVLDF